MALKDRALRLLRQEWPDATALAQEMYAILKSRDRVGAPEVDAAPDEGVGGPAEARAASTTEVSVNLGGVTQATVEGPPRPGAVGVGGFGVRRRLPPEPEPSRPRRGPGTAQAARPGRPFGPGPAPPAGARPAPAPAPPPIARPGFTAAGARARPAAAGPTVVEETVERVAAAAAPVLEGWELPARRPLPTWDSQPPATKAGADVDRLPRRPPPAQGHNVWTGVVQSGSGNQYQVDLYPQGFQGAPGLEVTVYIPQIAFDETIPEGTVLSCIHDYGNGYYESQPPVWLNGP